MERTKLSIRTGVAEIESELSGLDLNRHGVGRRRGEIYISPGLHPEDSESQDFRAYENQGGNHQTLGAAGKILELGVGPRVRELPDEKRQKNCAARKETPASAMVSDICSSISGP